MAGVLAIVLCVLAATVASEVVGVERMRVQHMESPTVDPDASFEFSWVPTSADRDVSTLAHRVLVREKSGSLVWDSGKVASEAFKLTYAGPALKEAEKYEWAVQWWPSRGTPSKLFWSSFRSGLRDWGNSTWIGGAQAKLLRQEFKISSPSSQATVFISGEGLFQLYVNGMRVDSGVLSGAWTTFNERVIYFTYDITHLLKIGNNAIGVMLGRGWRNLDSYPVEYDATPCDKNERVVRANIVADGKTIVVTDGAWQVTSNSPIVSDSIYNGETYDARLEQVGWDLPNFSPGPSGGWAPATVISCFNPVLSPLSIPEIGVDDQNRPVRFITPTSDCPDGIIGGLVPENTNLTLSCAAGTGVISNILFASYGTPSGSCGSYKVGSCDAKNALQLVKAACEGKTSCFIPATNNFFNGDPCYDTAKSLAIMANGCTSGAPSKVVVDFGENLSGWTKIRVKGPAGTTVTLRHAEVLQHPPYGPADGNIYTGNLRSAQATDVFILKGDPNGEIFEPHFTYHGYQYVEVTGYPGVLTADNITQIHFHSLVPVRVKFNSSSPILNAIQNCALKGQGSNLMSVPTDCDQRDERLGWMGDADLSADSFAINYDYAAFQDAYLNNMIDAQPADGSLPDVVPFVRYGGRPGDVSWSAALPQNVYVRYKPAQTHWDSLLLYFNNLASQFAKAGGNFNKWSTPYGDWVPAGPTKVDNQVCTGFSYIVNSQQMAELATALNRTADAQTFTALAARLSDAFNAAFYHSDRTCWDNCVQSAYALPLRAGVAPAAAVQPALNALINDVVTTQRNHVTVGIIGAKALFQLLKSTGHVQVGIDLAEQTSQPSWGYMIYNDLEPATSNLWELWDSPTQGPGMNSRNHHMFSSISEFIVTAVTGVSDFSCKSVLALRPSQAFGVSWAQSAIETECGTVQMAYQRMGGQQCAKVPEGRSALRPNMVVVDDYELGCGELGGVITSVDFASWGLPDGTCGAFAANSSCDVNVLDAVKARCVGKASCMLSSKGTEWPAPTCAGPYRLFAQVTCSAAHAVAVDVSVPVAVPKAEVHLPLFSSAAEHITIMEGDNVIFKNSAFSKAFGVSAVSVSGGNAVVTLGSGSYSLRLLSQ